MMVGGAMFPQCLPRRSADSLSPSRISMKSYLRGDSEKDTDEQSDHSEGLGRTIIPLWLSPFFHRHPGAAVSTKGTLLALVHRQTQTREVVFKLHCECTGGRPYLLFTRALPHSLRISEQALFVLGWQ